jgi:hypothetical protein
LDEPPPDPGQTTQTGPDAPEVRQKPLLLVEVTPNCPVVPEVKTLLLNELTLRPEKVIVPEELIPVAAATAPEELTWNWELEPTEKIDEGLVLPIPTFPLFPRYKIELAAKPVSPLGDLWKLRDPLSRILNVWAVVAPLIEILADIDAEPTISKAVKGVVVPIPTLPELIIRFAAGVIVRFPELLEITEFPEPPIDNFAVGAVVPIPIFPLFPIYKAEVNPVSPPGLVWKLRELLFKRLKVSVPAFPVGTAKDRLPEIVAVGVPPAILIKPNFAEEVDVPPMKKSTVLLLG